MGPRDTTGGSRRVGVREDKTMEAEVRAMLGHKPRNVSGLLELEKAKNGFSLRASSRYAAC